MFYSNTKEQLRKRYKKNEDKNKMIIINNISNEIIKYQRRELDISRNELG